MAMNQVQLTGGMRANLFSLQQTIKLLEITQKRLSTGKESIRLSMIRWLTLPHWDTSSVQPILPLVKMK